MKGEMSLTGKRWELKRSNIVDIVQALKQERGITDDPSAKLSDPYLFPEMEKAVRRIRQAISAGEKIAVFGDYDADGVTASAQLLRYFRRRGSEPVVYLPDRQKDGYGMKKQSVKMLADRGVTLVITVDTGVAAHDEISYAASLGMDVIVTDHHRVHEGRPEAFAVIHPHLPTPFPNPNLSGSGVAFMLVRALEDGQPWEGIEFDIALASIGTIGDLVPLTGENRTLVMHGLKFLAGLPPSPLKDFLTDVKVTGSLTAGDVAFRIVPRINAAGRMAHPDVALKALLEGGDALKELHRLNGDRRSFVEELDRLLRDDPAAQDLFVVVGSEDVTPGTAGLLASRFTERLGKPSLVAAILGENAVASVRSPASVDVMECLTDPDVTPLLLTFGGHAQAAGCSVRTADLPALRRSLCAVMKRAGYTDESLTPTLSIDAVITPVALGIGFVKQLRSLEPFGAGNEEPVFLLRGQRVTDMRAVGSEAGHLQCRVGDTKAIGFGLGSLIDRLNGSTTYDIACRLGINAWSGRETPQILIEDLREA